MKGKRRGGQKKRWEDNISEWTWMGFANPARAAEDMTRWKGILAQSYVVPQRPCKVMARLGGKFHPRYLPVAFTGLENTPQVALLLLLLHCCFTSTVNI